MSSDVQLPHAISEQNSLMLECARPNWPVGLDAPIFCHVRDTVFTPQDYAHALENPGYQANSVCILYMHAVLKVGLDVVNTPAGLTLDWVHCIKIAGLMKERLDKGISNKPNLSRL